MSLNSYGPATYNYALLGLTPATASIAPPGYLTPNALVSTDAYGNLESATVLTPNLSFTANQLALNVNLILKSIAGTGGQLDISTALTMVNNDAINSGTIVPNTAGVYDIGSGSLYYVNGYFGTLTTNNLASLLYTFIYAQASILPAQPTWNCGDTTFPWGIVAGENIDAMGNNPFNTVSGYVNFVTFSAVVENSLQWVQGTGLVTGAGGTVIDDGSGQILCSNLTDSALSGTANIVFGNASKQLTSTIPGICVVHTIEPFAASTNDCGTTINPWLNVCSNGLVAIGTNVNSSGTLLFLNSVPVTKATLQWNNGVGLQTSNGNVLDDGSSNATVRGNQTVLGGVTCGTLDVQGSVSALSTDLIPSAPFMYKLGSSTDYWQYVYCTLCQLCDAVGNVCGLCTQTNIGTTYSLAFPGPWGSSLTPAHMQTEYYGLQQVVTYVADNVQQGTSATAVTATSGTFATLITVSFTPLRSSSTVRISVTTTGSVSAAGAGGAVVFRGATNCATALNGASTTFQYFNLPAYYSAIAFTFVDAPATTSAISYTLQVYCSSGGGTSASIGLVGQCSLLLCEEIFS